MYKITVNTKFNYSVEPVPDNKSGKINGKAETWDAIKIKEGLFHIIKDNKSYTADVVKADYAEKSFVISVNGTHYRLAVKDKFDELLKSLGMDILADKKINHILAPMPGLVIDVSVKEGASIKKGDPLIVLEAMKMENILKSPVDGIIKKVNVSKGSIVEKNQVLIQFG
jgi:acetyl/propionyl-CoA carboxylase alpha subunit